jgi:hypothetical protein
VPISEMVDVRRRVCIAVSAPLACMLEIARSYGARTVASRNCLTGKKRSARSNPIPSAGEFDDAEKLQTEAASREASAT